MPVLAALGAHAFWMLYLWLGSAAAAAELARRKGYPEVIGLGTGLGLSVVGLLVWLLIPAKPHSPWARRRRPRGA